mmetsp:Transcript_124114/g.247262  ORF Transcript_124114/g.247262 Transcript_124114/m.247262 type:complete len:88 (-) Transcript_124114:127-390(-)
MDPRASEHGPKETLRCKNRVVRVGHRLFQRCLANEHALLCKRHHRGRCKPPSVVGNDNDIAISPCRNATITRAQVDANRYMRLRLQP